MNAFISLLKRYKDIFAWNYQDLKTYDPSIIQNTIPMVPEVKPILQKLRKIHPNLETQIKNELNKLLKSKIIFPVRHSKWVSNLVHFRKIMEIFEFVLTSETLIKHVKMIIFLYHQWNKF